LFIASRAGGAWSTDGLLPTSPPAAHATYFGWNEALSTSAALIANSPTAAGLYLRDTGSGEQQLVVAGAAVGTNAAPAGFAGESSQLYFESKGSLAAGAAASEPNAYALNGGVVSLVGRVPGAGHTECDDETAVPVACGTPPGGSIAGPYAWFGGSLTAGGPSSEYLTQGVVSADGNRMFFTEAGTGRLFVREQGVRTVQVSAPNTGVTDPNGEEAAAFLQATPDGSRVFFLSCQKLTSDSTATSTGSTTCSNTSEQGQDLYAYDAEAAAGERLTDLTVDHEGDPHGAQVVGYLGASRDGNDVYFVANGRLAPGTTLGNCTIGQTVTGSCNLYMAHLEDGHAPAIKFIRRLEASASSVFVSLNQNAWEPLVRHSAIQTKASRVAADSGALLLSSNQQLTSYENHGVAELYRYSPQTFALTCVSCNPTGAAPVGQALLQAWMGEEGILGHVQPLPFLTRNISANGDRVFFQTPDKLVGADVNGESGCPLLGREGEIHEIPACTDVYEWEAPDSASPTDTCSASSPSYSAQDEGCIYLISSGTSTSYSLFGDADEEGENVFFFTESALVPQDTDQLIDVYDAHVNGGLASQQGSPPTPECTAEGCRAAASAAASQPSAGSSSFSGPGNAKPKPNKHKKKHTKHHKKKGSKKRHGKHKRGSGKRRRAHRDRRAGK
jgi:hypothetical protein